MDRGGLQEGCESKRFSFFLRFYEFLACYAWSVIIFAALFCTLAAKFFHAYRNGQVGEYFSWILTDVAVLLLVEVILALMCYHWRRRNVFRFAVVVALVVWSWSLINAGWLIKTGTQILPMVFKPLYRDPLNTLAIVGVNLIKMPEVMVILFVPAGLALFFFILVLLKPHLPEFNRRFFLRRIFVTVFVVFILVLVRGALAEQYQGELASAGMYYNSQLYAVMSLILYDDEVPDPARRIPSYEAVNLDLAGDSDWPKPNIVVLVLEGIQYKYTSLADRQLVSGSAAVGGEFEDSGDSNGDLTPYLASLAKQGVEFSNTRTVLTHTTKALFSLFTGRYPSFAQDVAEAVPVDKPYASLVTIVKRELGYRTGFFQSAKGNFEARAGLVHNLGFEKFYARDDLGEPNTYLGYLSSDEFAMIEPIAEWIESGKSPFLLTVLCSVSHDPYEVPDWYAEPAEEPLECYTQAVCYTDSFIRALDGRLGSLGLRDETIFCVIGDHGEAFGEHGMFGHERIAFDEGLRVPFVIRAGSLIEAGSVVSEPVGTIDMTPTLLYLLGFEVSDGDFAGCNVLSSVPAERRLYFSGWMFESPAGYIKGDKKYVYNPPSKDVLIYDLSGDAWEVNGTEPGEERAQEIAEEILSHRRRSIFRLNTQKKGQKVLYDRWYLRWRNRSCIAKFLSE